MHRLLDEITLWFLRHPPDVTPSLHAQHLARESAFPLVCLDAQSLPELFLRHVITHRYPENDPQAVSIKADILLIFQFTLVM